MPEVERYARGERGESRRTMPAEPGAAAAYAELVREAARCTRCDLYKAATRTVFGEGPVEARLMLVGEIPGDMEDRRGRPFVGPAGRLLDRALEEAGVDRSTVYLTNAVKHFKFELIGRRRQHRAPSVSEINACHYWLDRELALVKPHTVVALGGTAARAVFGKPVRVLQVRGKFADLEPGRQAMVTIHPSAILRMPEESMRHQAFETFVSELRLLRNNG
ncbi:MAG: UdgX family uracil-DNA binding protein [Desulfocurvibacter africanus]